MTIEKLKSGSYRITQMHKGERYRVTIDHKPSAKEATILMAEEMRNHQEKKTASSTFESAYKDYVSARSNTCSPTTLRGYQVIIRNIPQWFKALNIYDVDPHSVQKMINEYAENHSPKSCRNVHGLVAAVLKMARPEIVLRTKLPDKKHQDIYIPTDEEVKAILQEVKGTKYEVPLNLAVFGLRRSEICALTIDDLDGNMISVTKAKVQKTDESWTIKETPKTDSSNRKVYVTDYVRDLILKQGNVYDGHPELINRKLDEVQDRLGINHFSLHKLRHYFASMTHDLGIADADILRMGGWSSDHIMKTVYRHSIAQSVSEGQRMYADKIGAFQGA